MLAASLPDSAWHVLWDDRYKKSSRGLFLVHLSMFCTLDSHGAHHMCRAAPHCLALCSESLSAGILARNVFKIH